MDSQLIISVGREFGSAGHEIAEELSKHYGIDLLDHNLLDEIAMEKQVDPESLRHHDEKQKAVFTCHYFGSSHFSNRSLFADQQYRTEACCYRSGISLHRYI